jgi:hypothetical protein
MIITFYSQVLSFINLSLVEVRNALELFSSLVDDSTYALFYYNGHALGSGDDMYLAATDSELRPRAPLESQVRHHIERKGERRERKRERGERERRRKKEREREGGREKRERGRKRERKRKRERERGEREERKSEREREGERGREGEERVRERERERERL